ncbi:MAG: hypothetical protein HFG44_00900 [Oscillospiraceae bacterium]|nr:hypothetical protein [Oscillospiraceae bacterium]
MNCLCEEDILLAVACRDLSEENRRRIARVNAHARQCGACKERLAAAETLYTVFAAKERAAENPALQQELESSMILFLQMERTLCREIEYETKPLL